MDEINEMIPWVRKVHVEWISQWVKEEGERQRKINGR